MQHAGVWAADPFYQKEKNIRFKKFPEKRILITGAGSGFGRALALVFAEMGWHVAIAEINPKRTGRTAEMVKQAGGRPIEIYCDVTRPEDLEAAAKRIQRQWGGLDILVNNAGVAAAGLVENTPLETWEWILAMNTKSIIYGCRAFIPMLKAQGAGHIVNMASAAGIASLPEMACYNVTKAATISLTETLRSELAPFHIGVSVICPTFFKTNLMDQFTSPDAQQREMANAFFNKSRYTSENIARHVVRSINRNRFYILTQRDARLAWRLKRFFPELYFKVVGFIYRTGLYKRYLSI